MFTGFLAVQADYQISPWQSTLEMYYQSGNTHKQSLFQELSHASFNVGLKAGF
jgi:hypothetical protein